MLVMPWRLIIAACSLIGLFVVFKMLKVGNPDWLSHSGESERRDEGAK